MSDNLQIEITDYYDEKADKESIKKIMSCKPVNHRIPAGYLKNKEELKKYLFQNGIMDINSYFATELMSTYTNSNVHAGLWRTCSKSKDTNMNLNVNQIKECFEAVECNNASYFLTVKLDPYFIRPFSKLPECKNQKYPVYNKLTNLDPSKFKKEYK